MDFFCVWSVQSHMGNDQTLGHWTQEEGYRQISEGKEMLAPLEEASRNAYD